MAKSKSAKKPMKKREPTKAEQATKDPLQDPEAIHTLLGIYGPYDPPAPPVVTKGYVTWWDPGASINTLVKKHRELFHLPRLFEGERCAKDSDSWKWRQWRIEPVEADLPFEEQKKQLKTGDEPATAREIVMYLALRFLLLRERLDLGRLRTKDLAANSQRMTVWFSPSGFDLASVADTWKSPGIGLAAVVTPKRLK